ARDLRTAIQYFSNSMVGDTVFTMAYLNRGLSWFELGDYDKAIEDINVVVDRKPDELYLKYYIEGVAAAKQGNLEIAGDNLDQAVELKDDFAAIYTWRGLVSSEREQYQKALKSFLRSIQLDPGQTILYINISNMYYYLQDYRNALSWLKRANNAGEAIDREFLKKLDELVNGKVIN
ncbi:MAG TPA: tetratricopeptide repeat protein, partial [Bacteroidales bacterium]|nr:tetratricopeptide repeat protein [Bacteroidales bacterium]